MNKYIKIDESQLDALKNSGIEFKEINVEEEAIFNMLEMAVADFYKGSISEEDIKKTTKVFTYRDGIKTAKAKFIKRVQDVVYTELDRIRWVQKHEARVARRKAERELKEKI